MLKQGDILSIDFGAFKDGWCGDSARTIPIGEVSPAAQALMRVTRESLDRAIASCTPGNRLGDIGWAVQSHAEANGYSVVRQFVGHGIGRAMHEEPHVPNYGEPRQAAAPDPRTGDRHRADGQRRGARSAGQGRRVDGCNQRW